RHAAAAHFAVVDHEAWLVGHGRPHHLEPPLGARIEPRPMRRAARRHETHFGEIELLPQLIGGAEVPAVNRIEGAAEDADRLHGFRPPAYARARACARRSAPRARA